MSDNELIDAWTKKYSASGCEFDHSDALRELVAATRSQALQEAAQAVAAIRINTKKFSHVENVGSFATGIETAVLTLRALAAQPAASPACSNCGVTGQVSGPGTATLCMACGHTTQAGAGISPAQFESLRDFFAGLFDGSIPQDYADPQSVIRAVKYEDARPSMELEEKGLLT